MIASTMTVAQRLKMFERQPGAIKNDPVMGHSIEENEYMVNYPIYQNGYKLDYSNQKSEEEEEVISTPTSTSESDSETSEQDSNN